MRTIKKIIPRVTLLIVFVLVLNGVTRFAYETPENPTLFTMRDERTVKGTVDTIMVGTSLILLGMDPEILDEELGCISFNMASSSQAMSGSYYLVKDQARNNPIKRIFYGISVVGLNMERSRAELVPSKLGVFDRIMSPIVRAEYILDLVDLPYYEKFFFYPCRISDFLDFGTAKANIAYKLSDAYKQGISPEGTEFPNQGMGFQGTDVCKLTPNSAKVAPLDSIWGRDLILEENIVYIKKLGEFCRKNGIECNIILMPHADMYAHMQGDLADMDRYFEDLCSEIGADLYSFNYTSYESIYDILPDECYYDSKHLNLKGSEIFTKLVAEEYRKRH